VPLVFFEHELHELHELNELLRLAVLM
jgi:hypothetical protein